MKRIVNVSVIFLSFLVLIVVIDACEGKETGQFRLSEINSIALRLLEIKTRTIEPYEEYYSTIAYINLSDTLEIRYDSLGIDITTGTEYFLTQNSQFNNTSFINSCYANDQQYSYEKIVDIIVTSNKDYSNNLPKGSDLSGIMNITYGHSPNGINIESFLTSYNCEQLNVILRFLSPPDSDVVHTITIKYITEHGNEVETTPGQLLIKK
jgi:hypothetical protein